MVLIKIIKITWKGVKYCKQKHDSSYVCPMNSVLDATWERLRSCIVGVRQIRRDKRKTKKCS